MVFGLLSIIIMSILVIVAKIKMNCKLAFKCFIYCKSSLLYAENETYSFHLKSLHLVMYRLVT